MCFRPDDNTEIAVYSKNIGEMSETREQFVYAWGYECIAAQCNMYTGSSQALR